MIIQTNHKKVWWAWGVHILTTMGTLCAMASMVNILNWQAEQALVWLMVAKVIDGIDGPLARYINVQKYTPVIDGNALDLIVDYVTCVVVPILFAVRFNLLPEHLEMTLSILVIMTSAIWFSRKDIETKDLWFRGFPAEWNFVVTVLWLLNTTQPVNALIFVVFIVLTLMPSAKFAHILGAPQFRRLTIPFTITAMFAMVSMTVVLHERHNHIGKIIIVAWVVYYLTISLWRSLMQPDELELLKS